MVVFNGKQWLIGTGAKIRTESRLRAIRQQKYEGYEMVISPRRERM